MMVYIGMMWESSTSEEMAVGIDKKVDKEREKRIKLRQERRRSKWDELNIKRERERDEDRE